jgi:effector-binding domain-containing protein
MLVRLFITILVIALALLAGAVLLPSQVHVERSINIDRPPAVVFGVLNNFQHFQTWSPWSERDPNARYQYSGPDQGVGARMSWSGDPRQVGSGWQEIRVSEPFRMIRTHLAFEGQGEADAYFEIRPVGEGSRVEWGFDTDVTENRSFLGAVMGKYMGLFMDRWIGGDYEFGLDRLKDYAESFPDADFSEIEIERVEVSSQPILYVSTSSGASSEAIARALGAAFGEISRFMSSRGLAHNGMPMSINHSWDEDSYEFDAAIPVDRNEVSTSGNVQFGFTPSGIAVRAVHVGPYTELDETYEKLIAYMSVNRLGHSGVSWEHYISDPGDTPEDQLVTHVYFLLEE